MPWQWQFLLGAECFVVGMVAVFPPAAQFNKTVLFVPVECRAGCLLTPVMDYKDRDGGRGGCGPDRVREGCAPEMSWLKNKWLWVPSRVFRMNKRKNSSVMLSDFSWRKIKHIIIQSGCFYHTILPLVSLFELSMHSKSKSQNLSIIKREAGEPSEETSTDQSAESREIYHPGGHNFTYLYNAIKYFLAA